jgi:hypothetical protein
MNSTIGEVLEFVKENDVQFIRLSFCQEHYFNVI